MGKVCSRLSGREGNVDIGVIAPILGQFGLTVPAEAHAAPMKQVSLTGRKRSLFIGINYCGTQNELHGCANDVKRMLPVIEGLGFPRDAESQRVLLDEAGSPSETKPTRANIEESLSWLVQGAQPGDSLFFHYSGHGGQEPAEGTNDSYHETLVPLDFQSAGMLRDTELFDLLVKSLPSGCRLTCILDSCHSAGALNLPYRFVGTEQDLKAGLAGEIKQMVMSKNWSKDVEQWKNGHKVDMLKDIGAMGLGLWKIKQKAAAGGDPTGFKTEEQANADLHVGEVVAITGCRSDQTSADVGDVSQQFHLQPIGEGSRGSLVIDSKRAAGDIAQASGAGGALTTALLQSLQSLSSQPPSYLQLLENIRQGLESKGFSQVPQVVTSLVVDLKQDFALDTVFIPQVDNAAIGTSHDNSGDADGAGKGNRSVEANPTGVEGGEGYGVDSALQGFLSSLANHPQGSQMC